MKELVGYPGPPWNVTASVNMSLLNGANTVLIMKRMISLLFI